MLPPPNLTQARRLRSARAPSIFGIPCWLFIILSLLPTISRSEEKPKASPFDRQELWVPANHLAAILKKNPKAVLLTRAQYETLLKDAELHFKAESPDPEKSAIQNPQPAIRHVALTATPEGDAIRLIASYTVESPVTGWTELPIALDLEHLASVQVNGLAALRPFSSPSPAQPQQEKAAPPSPTLLLRGPDQDAPAGTTVTHEITLTSILPLRRNGAGASFAFDPPNAATASLTLSVPKDAKLDSALPFTLSPDRSAATFALGGRAGNTPVRIGWSSDDIAPLAGSAIFQKGRYLYSIDPVRVHADLGFVLSSSLRDLPEEIDITLPPEAKILGVEGTDVLRWDADETAGSIKVTLVPGKRRATDIRILSETPAIPEEEDESEIALPRPEVEGIHRASGTFAIFGSPEIRVRSIGTGPLTIQSHGDLDPAIINQPGFVAGFRFPSATGDTTVRLQRLRDRFTADLDTQITLQREAIYIERTAAIIPAEGQLFETVFALPPGEEIISVLLDSGTEPSWKRLSNTEKPEAGTDADNLRITWPEGLQVGTKRTLKIRTRRDPSSWFDLDEKPLSLQFQSATLKGAEKVAGYIAVDFGPSFQVHTAAESGLERRFAGSGEGAPVRGQLAWFRLRDYDLKLDVSRRPAEVEAEIIAYALPLAGTLEIEGQINLTIGLTPLQKLEVALPPEAANHFRLDSSLVSEKTLDPETGKWLFRFHRDLTQNQSLRFRLNLPFDDRKITEDAKSSDSGSETSDSATLTLRPAQRSFATFAPPISLPGAKRLRGWWLIEANTDTELTFAPEGLDESDALRVPALPGYTPRHRVIAAYQFRGSDYTLAIAGKRHTPEPLVTTVVEMLTIDSILSTDGISRHQILVKVRSAGEQFFEITLPTSREKDKASPADLWTLAVDGIAVKPVRGRTPNTLRIALPDSATDGRPVLVKLVYQTTAAQWHSKGDSVLQPPTFANGVPVLDSSWRLHLPEGYTYDDFDSNLRPRFQTKETPLVSILGEKLTRSAVADAKYEPQIVGGHDGYLDSVDIDGGNFTQDNVVRREFELTPEEINQDDPARYPPALTPAHVLDVQGVELLLKQGSSYYDLGDFENARQQFWEVLRLDRYNSAARRMLEKVEQRTLDYESFARDYTRERQLRGVDELWENQVPDDSTAYIQAKLNAIVLPRVQFTDARIDEAIEFLRIKSKDHDPEASPELKGISIILQADPETAPRITLDLQNVPLFEALRYVTELAGMKFKVEPSAVLVAPLTDASQEIHQRTIQVSPDFFNRVKDHANSTQVEANPVDPFGSVAGGGGGFSGLNPESNSKQILESIGIAFPEGTSAHFDPATGQLTVTQTPDNLAILEQFVTKVSPDPIGEESGEPLKWKSDSAGTGNTRTARGTRVAGLIPLDFDLPDEGVTYTFEGLYAPAELEFEFVAWERQIRVGWLWIALGAILYFFLAFDRPVFLGLFVAILFAFLPTAIWQSSTQVFNAILIGWLGAMAVRLLTRFFQKQESHSPPAQTHAW